ncbi:YigZ family protein [Alkalibaculum sporogenes]|nr:YigZ family protein [Alkalibaculum sporogenes]
MHYYTIEGHNLAEDTIKKSRFIINCYHVENQYEVEKYLKNIYKEHYKATHNTFAYILGEEKNIQKYSDDGEPSGTAGKPILEAINQRELSNVLVVVTRYFGGIKLGGGGLIRAYNGSACLGLKSASFIRMQYSALIEISFEYTYLGKIKAFLDKEYKLKDTIIYDDKVHVKIFIPAEESENLIRNLVELTNDNIHVSIISEEYIKLSYKE